MKTIDLMQEVSAIFGIYVTAANIDREMKILEQTGKFTTREVHELLILIIKKLNERELSPSIQPTSEVV